jgi:hypothetical protein
VCIDITRTISIPGGLRVWRSLQRFARQYFGGHKEKQEVTAQAYQEDSISSCKTENNGAQ